MLVRVLPAHDERVAVRAHRRTAARSPRGATLVRLHPLKIDDLAAADVHTARLTNLVRASAPAPSAQTAPSKCSEKMETKYRTCEKRRRCDVARQVVVAAFDPLSGQRNVLIYGAIDDLDCLKSYCKHLVVQGVPLVDGFVQLAI